MEWRQSTYSSNGGADCVEIGQLAETVAVRDTTDRNGATLGFTAQAWLTFLETIR
jgi:Domain of unknown function (DUF397)